MITPPSSGFWLYGGIAELQLKDPEFDPFIDPIQQRCDSCSGVLHSCLSMPGFMVAVCKTEECDKEGIFITLEEEPQLLDWKDSFWYSIESMPCPACDQVRMTPTQMICYSMCFNDSCPTFKQAVADKDLVDLF